MEIIYTNTLLVLHDYWQNFCGGKKVSKDLEILQTELFIYRQNNLKTNHSK